MKILHVGWGYTPWRGGGLITYAEDVMEGQARAGHRVAYFCAGRHYPGLRRPHLHRWRRRGVRMFEVLNTPLPVGGTQQPESDLTEPQTERLFRRVLARFDPDVLHVQELAGLPSSIIDMAHEAGVPVIFTLQDYFALCPTIKLFDADERICQRLEPGAMCQVCCAAAPGTLRSLRARTAYYELDRLLRRVPRIHDFARTVGRAVRRRRATKPPQPAVRALPASAAAYQRRRDVNVARLSRVDALLATSSRVAEIQRELGVADRRLSTLHLTVDHLRLLTVRRIPAPPRPVHFATLNGASGTEKGAQVLREALRRLRDMDLVGDYRVSVFGAVDPSVRNDFEQDPSVCIHGIYSSGDLDRLLADVDVGLVPSIWEEPYAHVGLEFLAKGIPVISNVRGGLPDYTRPGITGWLNTTADGGGLAELMAGISRHSEQVVELHRRIVEGRADVIKPVDTHLRELETIYRDVISERRWHKRAT